MPESSGPRVAVVLPVYGNWEDTLECLKALERQTIRDFQVFISDDGSLAPPPRGVSDGLYGRYSRGEHAGYGASCRSAAREAIASGATHLLFLNNDVVFGDRFMECWIRYAAEMPGAILSPLVHWSRRPDRIWSSGGPLSVFTPFVRPRSRFQKITEVDIITGCAMMIPVLVWTALGGFDPKYEMYFEDFDFVLKAKERGVRTRVVPDPQLIVLHHVSGSFRESRIWTKHYLMLSSQIIFIRTHYRGITKPICMAMAFAHLALVVLRSLPELPRPRLLWRAVERGFATGKQEFRGP